MSGAAEETHSQWSGVRKTAYQWFRFFNEYRTDLKILSLSYDARACFVALMCLANEGEPRGFIPLGPGISEEAIASAIGFDVTAFQKCFKALHALHLITKVEDGLLITNFEKRQRAKPSDSSEAVNERVRRHRAAKRDFAKSLNVDEETPVKRQGNASETPPDTDSDSDLYQQQPQQQGAQTSDDKWPALREWFRINCAQAFSDHKIAHRWLPYLQEMGVEVIQAACEEAALNGAGEAPSYVLSILGAWQTKGVRSLDDVNRIRTAHERSKTRRGKQNGKTTDISWGRTTTNYDALVTKGRSP